MGDQLDTLFITSAATGQTGELDGCLDMHPKKVTVLKVTGVELVTLSYF